MKVTLENIKDITPYPKEQKLLKTDLEDLAEINRKLPLSKHLYIYWEDQHTEYSPERTDPCPDYYGYFSIRNSEDDDIIGYECPTEDELEDIINVIWDMCNLLIN